MNFDSAFQHVLKYEGGYGRLSRLFYVAKSRSNMFHGLPASQSKFNGISRALKLFSPISQRQRCFTQSVFFSCCQIFSLFSRRRPSYISRLVSFSGINTIYCSALRRIPHVGVKSFKTVLPSVAHQYTFTSPQIKSFFIRVIAPFFNRRPSIVRSRASFSVFSMHLFSFFPSKTPARLRHFGVQFCHPDQRGISAVTKAFPSSDGSPVGIDGVWSALSYKQSAKTHSG